MRLTLTPALALLLLAGDSPGQGASSIKILPEHRVANTDPSGVCWFCCAATAGRHSGIPKLHDIDKLVLKTGVGHKTGATEESVSHWMNELGLKPLTNPAGKKDAEAVALVKSWLDRKIPVVASYSHSSGQHAVLLTRISDAKEKWKRSDGSEYEDHSVSYVDPDDHKNTWRATWTWFHEAWTGRAYAFDPEIPEHRPELRPGRLMAATGAFVPARKALPAHMLPEGLPGPLKGMVYETPVVLPRQLPFDGHQGAAPPPRPKVPSNQDIKDGVTRPSDVTRDAVDGDHDYYSEYKAFKAGKGAK